MKKTSIIIACLIATIPLFPALAQAAIVVATPSHS